MRVRIIIAEKTPRLARVKSIGRDSNIKDVVTPKWNIIWFTFVPKFVVSCDLFNNGRIKSKKYIQQRANEKFNNFVTRIQRIYKILAYGEWDSAS